MECKGKAPCLPHPYRTSSAWHVIDAQEVHVDWQYSGPRRTDLGRGRVWDKDGKLSEDQVATVDFFLKIRVQLLYNVVLVSALQQRESATRIHMTPPSWASPYPLIPHL